MAVDLDLLPCGLDLSVGTDGSKNHHFMGDISSLFIQEFAGLKPNPRLDDVNAWDISPHFVTGLDFARAFYLAPKGRISVRWDRTPEGVLIRFSAPEFLPGRRAVSPRSVRRRKAAPARKAAPIAVVSTQEGRRTGALIISAWRCIR